MAQQRLATQRALAAIAAEEQVVEEEATGPYIIPRFDIEVPGRCFSAMSAEDINTSSWYPGDGNILFLIDFGESIAPSLGCTNVGLLESALKYENGIMYRCTGTMGYVAGADPMVQFRIDDPRYASVPFDFSMRDTDYSVEYIPFSYSPARDEIANGYLPRSEVERIVSIIKLSDNLNEAKLFTIKFVDVISHTVSKNNTDMGTAEFDLVSTNHCQSGSAILTFQVKEFAETTPPTPPTPPNHQHHQHHQHHQDHQHHHHQHRQHHQAHYRQ